MLLSLLKYLKEKSKEKIDTSLLRESSIPHSSKSCTYTFPVTDKRGNVFLVEVEVEVELEYL